MAKRSKSFVLWGLALAVTCLPLLHAQTPTTAPAETNVTAATPAAAQAPDDVTNKITELVHAGKYTEAQQLTTGLLLAYPKDQRLIKAKALLDRLLATAGPAQDSKQPTGTIAPAQPAAATNAEQLTGMDKVDYNALIELARQAQQTTDLSQQKTLLQQFMDQSSVFLQKHPDQMLLWQLRAATAISLNDPLAGYGAGQKLVALGAADSNDPNVQRLLAQLKNKGWMDGWEAAKQATKIEKYSWVLGSWSAHGSWADPRGHDIGHGDFIAEFSQSDSAIDVTAILNNGKRESPYRGTILDSGEISWERHWNSDWKPFSVEVGNDKRTMKIVFAEKRLVGHTGLGGEIWKVCTYTGIFTKNTASGSTRSADSIGPQSATKKNDAPVGSPASESVATANPGSAPVNNPAPLAAAPTSAPGTATLHVYRPRRFASMDQKPDIYIDGNKSMVIKNGQAIQLSLAPGKHTIGVLGGKAKNDGPLSDLDMRAGEEYWVRADYYMSGNGFGRLHLKLSTVPSDQAHTESEKLKEVEGEDLSKK